MTKKNEYTFRAMILSFKKGEYQLFATRGSNPFSCANFSKNSRLLFHSSKRIKNNKIKVYGIHRKEEEIRKDGRNKERNK